MARQISDESLMFLADQYVGYIKDFLDDPDGICFDGTNTDQLSQDITKEANRLISIGKDIGFDFWDVCNAEGTTFEINRLKEHMRQN